MKKRLLTLALLSLTIAGFSPALSRPQQIAANAVTVSNPHIDSEATRTAKRMPPSAIDSKATEVFMVLINRTLKKRDIIAATSPAADKVQLHMTLKNAQGENIGMRQITDIPITGNGQERLHLGSLHVMLIGLNKYYFKLKKAEQPIPITLIYRDGSWATIEADITTDPEA